MVVDAIFSGFVRMVSSDATLTKVADGQFFWGETVRTSPDKSSTFADIIGDIAFNRKEEGWVASTATWPVNAISLPVAV